MPQIEDLKRDKICFRFYIETENKFQRTALFWAVTQLVVKIPYRRFGTTYRFYLQRSIILGP